MAVLGKEGVVEGLDYRGIKVVSVLRAIPNSPWFMDNQGGLGRGVRRVAHTIRADSCGPSLVWCSWRGWSVS